MACGILVRRPGVGPVPPAVEVQRKSPGKPPSFRFLGKNVQKIECSHCPFPPLTVSPVINILHQRGTSVTTDEPHSHMINIINVRVHSVLYVLPASCTRHTTVMLKSASHALLPPHPFAPSLPRPCACFLASLDSLECPVSGHGPFPVPLTSPSECQLLEALREGSEV